MDFWIGLLLGLAAGAAVGAMVTALRLRSGAQQKKKLVQASGNLIHAQDVQPRGDQFDRQRDPVNPTAQSVDGGGVVPR